MGKLLTRSVSLLAFVVMGITAWAQPTISCPDVDAGPDQNLPCTTPCTNLTATNLAGFQTTTYTVGQIPYNPYSYTTGTAIIVNIDDIWSPVLPIPFNFCFYGNVYNQCVVGANGGLSFNTANANAYNTWPIGAAIPSAAPADMRNCIMAPWHDIDPSVNQSGQSKSIKWATFGTAPCRTFVVSWYNIPMYGTSCRTNTALNATQQIVLYETTNIIETYIAQKRTCTSWNGGYAIHGIQNAAGTAAVVVPGRNFPTQWAATNDAWRFVPAGASNHTTTWYQVGNGVPVGSTPTVTVCPPAQSTTSYYAQVVYTNCDGSTVTVRDTVNVTTANSITAINPTVVQPACGNLGSISLNPSGGTPGYSYSWSPAYGNVSSISNLPAGTYSVTVTDQAGCTYPQTFTLSPSTPPVAAINNPTNVACNGGTTGSATVTVTGGTPGFGYTWNTIPVQNGATATGLGAGNYQVIVTDLNGCRDTAYVTLTQPPALTLNLNPPTNVLCNGASTGCVGAVAGGGNNNYSWLWSNGATTSTVCNLPAGSYTVTLTDTTYGSGFVGGYALCTMTGVATITQPAALATAATVLQPHCGAYGNINLNTSGGVPSYSYNWSPNQGNIPNPGNLAAGTYNVTITDVNGCTLTQSYILNPSPVPVATISVSQNVACNGGSNGSATVTVTSGTPNFTYTWNTIPVQNTATATGLSAGTYSVTVSDVNGCGDTTNVTISQPAPLVIALPYLQNVSCNGASDGCVGASGAGGNNNYHWSWSNSIANDTICNLPAGNYTVTLTDTAYGNFPGGYALCTATASATISQPSPLTVAVTGANVLCNGGTTCVTATPGGGYANYSYLWNTGATTSTVCSLPAGTYTVTLTDTSTVFNLGSPVLCTVIGTITITQPSALATTITGYDLSCNLSGDGMATVTHTGGTPGYNVLWSNGQTTDSISSLAAGTYTVTVTDNNGCTSTLSVTLAQPSPIVTNTSMTPVSCNGGSDGCAIVTASGGPSGVFDFLWSNGDTNDTICGLAAGTYYVTVTDTANGGCTAMDTIVVTQPTPVAVAITRTNAHCGQSNGTATATGSGGNGGYSYVWNTTPAQNTATAVGLVAGAYSVTVTDIKGCTAVGNITISDIPGPSIAISSVTNVACFGGNNGGASVTVSQGTAPVTVHWGTIPQQTGSSVNNLIAGSYWVWAIDSSGCVDSVQFTVTQPNLLTLAVTTVGAICNLPNGSAAATASGGTTPYSFAWSNSQSGPNATNLGAGNYSVTVTDAHGCTATQTFSISQAGAPALTFTTSNNITCYGGNDGGASVSTTGGVGPYVYQWNTNPVQTTPTASNLPAGTYTVTVTDQNGCQDHASVTLTQPSQLVGNMVTTPNSCVTNVPNGTAGVVVNGGTPPYGYVWNTIPVQFGTYVTGLTPGNYGVTVTDAHGCNIVVNGNVAQIPNPIVTAGPDVTVCEGEGGATITAVPSSGTPGYFFNWWCNTPPCGLDSINDNDPLANPTVSTWYYVQVTDTNGCTSNIDSVFLEVLPKPIVDAGPDIVLCGDQAPCQVLTPTITGAPGPYVYNWIPSTGLNNPTILNPCARPDTTTIYVLVVTAGNGCTSEFTTTDTLSSVTVFVNPIPIADAGPDRAICYGDSTQLTGTATGAGPLYTFEWTPANGLNDSSWAAPHASPLITTDYTLVVWSNGCPSYGDSVHVEVHTLPTIDAGWDHEICPGQDTLIDAFAGGDSTATYTYHWWPSTGIVGSADVEDPTVGPLQTTVYYVVATSSFGCESNPDSTTVWVRPAPQPNAGPNLFICPGDSVQLQGSYYFTTPDSAPANQIYFGWTPASYISDDHVLSPVVWPPVSTEYILDIVYSVCHYQDTVLVTMGPPTLAVALPDTDVICQGVSVQLDGTGSIGQDIQWIPSTGLSDPHSLTPTATPDVTTTYTLVMSEGGCDDSTSITVSVLPSPDAAYLSSLTNGCVPLTVYFSEVSGGESAYIWDFGDGSPIENLPNPNHLYAAPGTYNVSLTVVAPGGCTDEVHSINVEVTDMPVADFSSNPDFPAQLSMPNTNVVFTDESNNATEWYWDFGDGFTSSATNPSHAYSEPGTYFVTLMIHTLTGCMGEVTHGPYIVAVPDLLIPNVFSPNGDGINDEWSVQYTGDQPFTCMVYDRWGVRLWETLNKTAHWDGKNANGDPLVDGVYFYTCRVGNREFVGEVTLVR